MGLAMCRHRPEVAGMRRTLSFSARKNDVSESNDMIYFAGTLREMDWDAPR
jgi:hypothetical protein